MGDFYYYYQDGEVGGGRQDGRTDLGDQIVKVPLAPMLRSSSIGWLSMPETIISCNVLSPKPAANKFEPGRRVSARTYNCIRTHCMSRCWGVGCLAVCRSRGR